MFHHPNVEWTTLQAEAMGLRQDMVETSGRDELVDFRERLSKLRASRAISGLVTGAVASEYQKTRFDNVCDSVGLKTYAPLWHKKPKILVEDLKKANFRIVLIAVAAKGLDESWLGRELSDREWARLERLSQTHGIHLTGEGGEYESFVLDAPHFKKIVEIESSQKEWKGDIGRLVIEAASLRDKLSD
jgi:ABC transporter with metal-binding/Fe-S-binding domain ATP-binding protein